MKRILIFAFFIFYFSNLAFAETKESPLVSAVILDNIVKVEALLKQGEKADSKTDMGVPIIFSAIDKPKILKLLIQYGADINSPRNDRDKQTPLLWAVFNAANEEKDVYFESIKLLLKSGVDINKKVDKSSAMTVAITNSRKLERFKTVEFLLQNNADPNLSFCVGKYCISPLMNAVRLNNSAVVKLLIKYGADVNFRNAPETSSSALRLAVEGNFQEIVQLLKKAGAQ